MNVLTKFEARSLHSFDDMYNQSQYYSAKWAHFSDAVTY